MTKTQKIYREIRKYVNREDARYAAPRLLEILTQAKGD
jgi:hypothetical protein